MTTETTQMAPDRLERTSELGKRMVLLLAVIIVIGGVYWWTQSQRAGNSVPIGRLPIASLAGPGTPLEGNLAPDIAMTYADGKKVHLSDFRGRPVLVNFWATWCGPCRAEMPEIVRTYQQHKSDGLVVLAVNMEEPAEQIEPFVQAFNMTDFPVLMDASGQVTNAYQVRNLPSSFFIDRDGIIQVRWQGFLTPETMASNLAKILN